MTVSLKSALACVALLAGAANCLAGDGPDDVSWEARRTSTMTSVSQPYANQTYGFVVPSVAGARAYQDKPPNPNHGVILVLGERRSITVSAEYDAARLGTSRAYLDLLLRADDNLGRTTLSETRAAGHAAWSAIVRQRDGVKRFLTIRRNEGGGINVALILETTASSSAEDSKTFYRVARELRFVPLPN
jgi:hypothetical protein